MVGSTDVISVRVLLFVVVVRKDIVIRVAWSAVVAVVVGFNSCYSICLSCCCCCSGFAPLNI